MSSLSFALAARSACPAGSVGSVTFPEALWAVSLCVSQAQHNSIAISCDGHHLGLPPDAGTRGGMDGSKLIAVASLELGTQRYHCWYPGTRVFLTVTVITGDMASNLLCLYHESPRECHHIGQNTFKFSTRIPNTNTSNSSVM
eukprot:558352-Rhodomonas_salina.2